MAVARLGSGDEAMELFHMLNPINHSRTAARRRPLSHRAVRPGRGRLFAPRASGTRRLELVHGGGGLAVPRRPGSLLGLRRAGATFTVDPCIPASWPEYTIAWRSGATRYEITVTNPEHRCRGVAEADLDGAPVDPAAIPIVDDGRTHVVRVVLGAGSRPAAALGKATATA
jgi:cyclic beta-1,2-glucan synthetase